MCLPHVDHESRGEEDDELTCENRLEEFLRRKLRLQRVEEEVRRRIVLGFFDMLYYSRQFKRHMDKKRAGRMTAIPQLDIPEILVDNEEHKSEQGEGGGGQGGQEQQRQQQHPTASRSRAKSSAAVTTPVDGSGSLLSPSSSRAKSSQHRSWAGLGADLSSYDTSYGHPLAGPRGSRPAAAAAASSASPARQSQGSTFSFELTEPGLVAGDDADEATSLGRRGSSVDPSVVRDMLDNSVWVESLRRSATRKSGWGGPSGGFK
jgi:hypothetical protein